MTTHYLIIGSGILGASTAYHLAKKGVPVTIIDKKHDGQATDAAAGIVCPWLSQRRNKRWYYLAKEGAKYYPSLIEQLAQDGEEDTGYKRVGAISIRQEEEKLDKMLERALKRREEAPEIGELTKLTPEETKALFPAIQEDYRAIHVSGAARVNGRKLRDALLRAAKKHGAKLVRGEARLEAKGEEVHVYCNNEHIHADRIIITAGVWAKQLLSSLGIDFLVESQKAQIMHMQLPDQDTSTWPVVMPPSDHYLVAYDDHRVIAGATHENNLGFDQRVTAIGLQEILNKALAIAPGLAQSTIMETRVGFRPSTPGFLPVIGAIPGFNNLFTANGLGSSGLTTGPFLGQQLAHLALGEELLLDPTDYPVEDAIN
ncbi:NAD(P)/FAD-dependent oxidoreductase [Paraliobacillus ryukyuensis]|uniref:NAD(P)/FAD-dependent oxidoreductase n=1 Tax=Paraliobacillus ryukyuensis TaxID=200904 RepID=UPI0009A5F153|nr:FAD-binding oxidoreductase [Paraliobacillus ryukyuensis]